MRFRRIILRSLAPLLGLSALMAAMAGAEPASASSTAFDARTLGRFLRTVASFVAPAVEHGAVGRASNRPSRQSVLALSALAETRLCHSLWMVARAVPAPAAVRRSLPLPLRC